MSYSANSNESGSKVGRELCTAVRSICQRPPLMGRNHGVLLILSVTLSMHVVQPVTAVAQKNDEGKEIVRGLLRALVESQLDREGQRGQLRVTPPPNLVIPSQPTSEMAQLRPLAASFSQESATLSALLNTDSRRSFAVRKNLADVLQLNTTATILKQRADTERDHRNVLPGFRTLNTEWKQISFSLQQCPDLSPQSRQAVERLNRIDAQYCQILGLAEQFDQRELVRAADLLGADYRTLADEVSYATVQSGDQRRLVAGLRRCQEQSQLCANMAADNAPFPSVVAEYQSLHQSWQSLRPQMDQFTGRTILRTVSRIAETHRGIHQLLRLSVPVDDTLVQQLSQTVQRELSELFRTITLEQMLTLRDGRSISTAADTLAGTTQNLADVIVRREDRNVIAEAWLYVDESWQLFAYYAAPIPAPETRRRIDGLAQSLESLRSAIGVAVAYDPRVVSQQAVSLHALADQLQLSVRQWQTRPEQRDSAITRDMNRLETLCREVESLAASGRNRDVTHHKTDEILALWQQLRPRILQCTTAERDVLVRTADSFTPELVRLHIMLSE